MYNKERLLDLVERAAWTFVQAFAAVLVVTPVSGWKAALASAVAAGVSALKTFIKATL